MMEEVVPWVPKTFTNANDITSARVINYSFDYAGQQAGYGSFAFKRRRGRYHGERDSTGAGDRPRSRAVDRMRRRGSGEAQPPIIDMLRAGCTKMAWLMR